MTDKLTQSIDNLARALDRLGEALAEPESNPLAIDGTIQRFEFAIELYWKTLRRLLDEEGIATTTPREALQAAYAAGWLADEEAWLQMLRDRNKTSHVYSEAAGREIYRNIQAHYPELREAFSRIRPKAG